MEYKKRNCEFCGELFAPNQHNQIYCQKEECRKFSKKTKKEKETYLKNLKKKLNFTNKLQPENKVAKIRLQPENRAAKIITLERSLKQEVTDVQQFLYDIKNGNKVITQFKELAEKTINTMQLIKLDTYSDSVKAVCIDIMKNLSLFLQNQLKIEKDRGVIIVQAE